MQKIEQEGDICPLCYTPVRKVVRDDLRLESEKKAHPLSVEDLTILACRCLHPGDYMVGGFF